jgi:hypothetical protein
MLVHRSLSQPRLTHDIVEQIVVDTLSSGNGHAKAAISDQPSANNESEDPALSLADS